METQTGSPIRVAIIEDEDSVRRYLVKAVETQRDYSICGAYGTGEEALSQLPQTKPHVVLVDLHLPNIGGGELLVKLRKAIPSVSLLAITSQNDNLTLFSALRAGANGYLLKPFSLAELIEAIREARAGGSPISKSVVNKLLDFVRRPGLAEWEGFSRRENEILELLATGMSNDAISSRLHVSVETVRTHLKNLYRKMGVNSRTEAVVKYLQSSANFAAKDTGGLPPA